MVDESLNYTGIPDIPPALTCILPWPGRTWHQTHTDTHQPILAAHRHFHLNCTHSVIINHSHTQHARISAHMAHTWTSNWNVNARKGRTLVGDVKSSQTACLAAIITSEIKTQRGKRRNEIDRTGGVSVCICEEISAGDFQPLSG